MEAAAVFVKTQKGRDEVRTRSHQLSARERTTLIMIDGKRHFADLLTLSPTPNELEQHLHTLLQAQLICLQSETAAPAAEVPLAADTADDTSDLSVMQAIPDPELEKTRQFIQDVAQETLGADAAAFTHTLGGLKDRQALLNFAQHLRDVLYRITNGKEADQFLQTVRELAPKT